MGIRGELFSTKVSLQNRTYFFNVKENRMGDLYLNVVESKNQETGGFERQSVIVFADDLQDFLRGFDESLKVMEKAAREKRKGDKPRHASKESFHGTPGGQRPAPGRRPHGDGRPPREKNFGDRAHGQDRKPRRERPFEGKPQGERAPRDRRPQGDRTPGSRPSREKNFTDKSPRERQQQRPRKRVVRKKD